MSQFPSMNMEEIAQRCVSDGRVDLSAIQELAKTIQADYVITAAEAELLLRINRQVEECVDECPDWTVLVVDSVSQFVAFDMTTPGEISPEEASWLSSHLSAVENLSPNELRLLQQIKKHTSSYCESLQAFFDRAVPAR